MWFSPTKTILLPNLQIGLPGVYIVPERQVGRSEGFLVIMDLGYIRLHRKLTNHPRYTEGYWLRIWVHLLLKATWTEQDFIWEGARIQLKPGQFITSNTKVGKELGISRRTIDRYVDMMEKEGELTRSKGSAGYLYSITNWNQYQNDDPLVTRSLPARDPEAATIQKDKKSYPTDFPENSRPEGHPCIDGFPTLKQAIAAGENMMILQNVAEMWWNDRDGQGWERVDARGWQSNLRSYGNRWQANEHRHKNHNGSNGDSKPEPKRRKLLP